MSKILMVLNESRFFLSHRLPIARKASALGYEVVIVAKDTGEGKEIEAMGFRFIDLPVNPTGMNLSEEFTTFHFLARLYKEENPSIIHHIGLKYILWGSLAAKLSGRRNVVNAVCGLGGLFNGDKLSMTAKGILYCLRFSCRRDDIYIFQNTDDRDIMLNYKVLKENQVRMTNGSGINLLEYKYKRSTSGDKIKVIFTGRLVKEKGICDFIDTADMLRADYDNKAQFVICGRLTPNKTGVTKEYMDKHCDGKYIRWLGERNDIEHLLEESHVMLFPSYYREGIPKSLIEACAKGLPIITCDSVGCKETVEDGVNGFLVKPRSPSDIADKLRILIDNNELREKMGIESRRIAETKFSVYDVVNVHMNIYNDFLNSTQDLM